MHFGRGEILSHLISHLVDLPKHSFLIKFTLLWFLHLYAVTYFQTNISSTVKIDAKMAIKQKLFRKMTFQKLGISWAALCEIHMDNICVFIFVYLCICVFAMPHAQVVHVKSV